jgi:hypothetical protein
LRPFDLPRGAVRSAHVDTGKERNKAAGQTATTLFNIRKLSWDEWQPGKAALLVTHVC